MEHDQIAMSLTDEILKNLILAKFDLKKQIISSMLDKFEFMHLYLAHFELL